MDSIVKEELLRSIAVYFFTFMGFAALIKEGYLDADLLAIPVMAFIATAIHFSIMVRYRRRKERSTPSKTILPAIAPTQKLYKNLKIGIIAVLVYVLYLYASVEYNLTQKFTWLAIVIFLILSFGKIFLEDAEKHPLRLIPFFLVMYAFVYVRELVLGYPIEPRGFMIVGTTLVTFAVLSEITKWAAKPLKTKIFYVFVVMLCSILMGLLVGIL